MIEELSALVDKVVIYYYRGAPISMTRASPGSFYPRYSDEIQPKVPKGRLGPSQAVVREELRRGVRRQEGFRRDPQTTCSLKGGDIEWDEIKQESGTGSELRGACWEPAVSGGTGVWDGVACYLCYSWVHGVRPLVAHRAK